MTARNPVCPAYGSGQVVSPGAASASVTVTKGTNQLIATNTGTNIAYVRVGQSPQVATTADYPVPAGAQVVITRDPTHDTLAHISALGTTLHVMNGEGW